MGEMEQIAPVEQTAKPELTTAKCETCGKEFRNIIPSKVKAAMNMHMISHRPKPEKPSVKAENTDADISAARRRSETATETLAEKVTRLRKERKPMGVSEKKWSCPENDSYQYRVFNDNWMSRPGNIQKALAAGYEFVNSDQDKEKPQIVGTNDNGTAIKGYLMRIPKVIYDEDQTAKQKEVDKVDQQIRTGRFQEGAGDKRYIPTTGIKISADNQPPG